HHAARDFDAHRVRLEPFGRPLAVRDHELIRERVATEVVRKRRPALAQPREFRPPLRDEFIFVGLVLIDWAFRLLFAHVTNPASSSPRGTDRDRRRARRWYYRSRRWCADP